ncbi:MAG: FAD-dependent oxidoreductase [Proteobacteria bacterium]|nr:FAD-dependent oxidoreductase [Pseudomonadota bacterium]
MTAFDIAVLGGGPAGMTAAIAAAAYARVMLIDEHARPGGQVYRAPASSLRPLGADAAAGDAMRRALGASGATLRNAVRAWSVGGGPLVARGEPAAPFRIDLCDDAGTSHMTARALIVCAGAHERVIPFAGWTLPGVVGLAAATILLKSQGVVPGRRVVVAGTGPLLAAVAAGILDKGGSVAAVVDASARGQWVRSLPALSTQPSQLLRGTQWLARIVRAGVPVLAAHRILRAAGADGVEAVEVAPLQGGQTREIPCDAVCVGHGLVPATEATRIFGARHVFDPGRGGWIPVLDAGQRTTVQNLYAAGDGAGIRGAAMAEISGRAAALSALADLGLCADAQPARGSRMPRPGSAAFADAIASLMRPPGALVDAIPPDCVVCRCEDVTRGEIETAIDTGAADLNQIKHFTRCGMGPCQGRMCGEAAAELMARRLGGREAVGQWTARLPLRPVPLEAMLGEFDYGDIPIPVPAPI